jgi:hypothetical protein
MTLTPWRRRVRPAGKEPRTRSRRASILERGSIQPSELQTAVGGSQRRHASLQEGVLSLLAFYGIPAIPIHTGPRVRPRAGGGFELQSNRAQVGCSDVVAALPPGGRMALLELKTGQARRSPAQVRMHQRFSAAGALCVVVHDVRELTQYIQSGRAQIQGGK